VLIDGERWQAFPGPRRLLEMEAVPRLPAHKMDRLHAIARATLKGEPNAGLLLSLPLDEARERLMRLPGIGDFSADFVILRGAEAPDGLPLHEPRLDRATALASGVYRPPSAEEIAVLFERPRPYCTWTCLCSGPGWRRRPMRSPAEFRHGRPMIVARPAWLGPRCCRRRSLRCTLTDGRAGLKFHDVCDNLFTPDSAGS